MEIEDLPTNKKIILFDGICNLCDKSVQYIIKHDRKDIFRFVSIQSELGIKILKHIGVDNNQVDSIVLYQPRVAYFIKADAALKILKELNTYYRFLLIFSILPSFVKNSIYDFIASNRYKWYGKKESCLVPTQELKAKFLS